MTKSDCILLILLSFLAFFNIFDAFSTVWVLDNQMGYELNPIMNLAYEAGHTVFFVVKFGLTAMGLVCFWIFRNEQGSQTIVAVLTSLYGLLFLYQVIGLATFWQL